MKQEVPTSEGKSSGLQHSPMPVARARVSRTKESSRLGSPNGVSKASPKTPPKEANNSSRIRRPIDLANDQKGIDQPRTRAVDQYARVRRHLDMNCKGLGNQNDGKVKDDLERRLNVSDCLVNELRSEVSALKAQMEKLHSRNVLLESQNKQLGRDLSLAEAKIKALEKKDEAESISKEFHPSEFKDVREIIANKLDLLSAKKEVTKENKPAKLQSLALEPGVKSVGNRLKVQLPVPPPPPSRASPVAGPPPPPPPPPPRNALARANIMQKPTTFVDFYHSITKRDGKNGNMQSENCASPLANKAHNSIVDELQNRSSHLLAIKADVEKKRDFINHLIQKVQSAAFTDIEDVTKFVDWLDGQLSILGNINSKKNFGGDSADERAVLKHFNWPERKADALREAAFEYRDLKKLLIEVSSLENGTSLPCDAILKKITTIQDKSERSIQRLIKFRDTTMVSYRDFKIPTEWMLDSGIICKIKMGSVKLAKIYIKRVSTELESVRNTERESIQEALLLQGVRFAYRAYQFAGGLDSDTMRAFEELRERVQLHRRGSFML